MTFNASNALTRVRHCVAMAHELFRCSAAEGAATDQARIATLLDAAAARLPEIVEPAPDADQRAHVTARLLSHVGRLLADRLNRRNLMIFFGPNNRATVRDVG